MLSGHLADDLQRAGTPPGPHEGELGHAKGWVDPKSQAGRELGPLASGFSSAVGETSVKQGRNDPEPLSSSSSKFKVGQRRPQAED